MSVVDRSAENCWRWQDIIAASLEVRDRVTHAVGRYSPVYIFLRCHEV